jgi:hypothetical protein
MLHKLAPGRLPVTAPAITIKCRCGHVLGKHWVAMEYGTERSRYIATLLDRGLVLNDVDPTTGLPRFGRAGKHAVGPVAHVAMVAIDGPGLYPEQPIMEAKAACRAPNGPLRGHAAAFAPFIVRCLNCGRARRINPPDGVAVDAKMVLLR